MPILWMSALQIQLSNSVQALSLLSVKPLYQGLKKDSNNNNFNNNKSCVMPVALASNHQLRSPKVLPRRLSLRKGCQTLPRSRKPSLTLRVLVTTTRIIIHISIQLAHWREIEVSTLFISKSKLMLLPFPNITVRPLTKKTLLLELGLNRWRHSSIIISKVSRLIMEAQELGVYKEEMTFKAGRLRISDLHSLLRNGNS
jgi:hypothetical protein